jgi:hypothetical protein
VDDGLARGFTTTTMWCNVVRRSNVFQNSYISSVISFVVVGVNVVTNCIHSAANTQKAKKEKIVFIVSSSIYSICAAAQAVERSDYCQHAVQSSDTTLATPNLGLPPLQALDNGIPGT